jgi:hypothetical protein
MEASPADTPKVLPPLNVAVPLTVSTPPVTLTALPPASMSVIVVVAEELSVDVSENVTFPAVTIPASDTVSEEVPAKVWVVAGAFKAPALTLTAVAPLICSLALTPSVPPVTVMLVASASMSVIVVVAEELSVDVPDRVTFPAVNVPVPDTANDELAHVWPVPGAFRDPAPTVTDEPPDTAIVPLKSRSPVPPTLTTLPASCIVKVEAVLDRSLFTVSCEVPPAEVIPIDPVISHPVAAVDANVRCPPLDSTTFTVVNFPPVNTLIRLVPPSTVVDADTATAPSVPDTVIAALVFTASSTKVEISLV